MPLTKVCSFWGQVLLTLQSSKLREQKHNVSLLVGYWKWWYMGSLLLPPLGSCIHIFFPLGEMVPHTGLWFSILSLSWRMVPCRVLLLSWCFSCTFSRLFHRSFQASYFSMVWNVTCPGGTMVTGTLPHFLCFEVSPLVRCYSVNQAFLKSLVSGTG